MSLVTPGAAIFRLLGGGVEFFHALPEMNEMLFFSIQLGMDHQNTLVSKIP